MAEVEDGVTVVVLRLTGSCSRGISRYFASRTSGESPKRVSQWAPRCVIGKWGGGSTWVFLFAHVIRVNEKKSPQNLWKIGTSEHRLPHLGMKKILTISATSFKQGFFYFVVFGTLTSSRLQSKFFPSSLFTLPCLSHCSLKS